MEADQLCLSCLANAGLASDRCLRCNDYLAYGNEFYCLADVAKLSPNARLGFVLRELAALRAIEGREDHDAR